MGSKAMRLGAATVLTTGVFLIGSTAAAAETLPFWQIPEDGKSSSGAGTLDNPRGVAADSSSGHVYVADRRNMRVSEFTAWGVFVKAWGWDVAPEGAPGDTLSDQLEICTATCVKGTQGSGVGQFSFPQSMAVDSTGAVYVVEEENRRVQKFDSSGSFLLMFGGDVNKTKVDEGAPEILRNRCPVDPGDVCQGGTAGTGKGEFFSSPRDNYIAISPTNTIYVGDKERIQVFEPDGHHVEDFPDPDGILVDETVRSLATDPSGDLYVALEQEFSKENPEEPTVYELDSNTGKVTLKIEVGFTRALATDSADNLYVVHVVKKTGQQNFEEILKFDPKGTCLICREQGFSRPTDGTPLTGIATSGACNLPSDALYVNHFSGERSYVRAYGPAPDGAVCPPPVVPPEIKDQYAISADTDGAVVRTAINPNFWADTTYYVEYGTEECAKGGCKAQPAPPGSSLGGKSVNFALTSAGVFLAGLEPNTTYHYRFVAQSGGGGPVRGVGGTEIEDGEEATFTTFPEPPKLKEDCVNQVFRTGSSANLPDCRAYEMVSPLDKDNGDASLLGEIERRKQLNISSINGQRFTYSSYRAFADPQGASFVSQYLATRDPKEGWSNESISPPRGVRLIGILHTNDTEYKAFSPDLCGGWLRHDTDHPPFDSAAPQGYSNLYRRDNCGGGGYDALTTVGPSLTHSKRYLPEIQGLSADGSCAVFRANDKLTDDASSEVDNGDGIYQLYEFCGGEPRLVSVLPNGTASSQHSSAGTASGGPERDGRRHNVWQAVSADGSRVYWTTGPNPQGPGKIYVRENADQEQSALDSGGECSETEKACTYPVALDVAQFQAASPTGSVALFTSSGELREFDFTSKASTPVAEGVNGLLGASKDLSHVYLVSEEDLAAGASIGEPNLYLRLREGGEFTFIATLSRTDVINNNEARSPINREPLLRSARVTPDGLRVAFMSTAPLTGHDNTDANSGEADAEVFLYDAAANGGAGELICVSCNPTGVRPSGRAVLDSGPPGLWVAAQLSTWQNQLHPERALSDDGTRLFFESFEALVLRDTNGKQDVYQWEAEGTGDCDKTDVTFNEHFRGCVDLISSGQSSEDSEFLDATPTGTDVFFATAAGLLEQDYGLIDVYDAKVGGGFPPPPHPDPICEGEACQSPPAPPDDPTPASSTFSGPGNAKPERPRARRCPKGKRKVKARGKTRCVRKQGKKSRRGQRRQGRAAR